MFWCEIQDDSYLDEHDLYGAHDSKYLKFLQKVFEIQNRIFKAEPIYDKPGKHIYRPACEELEDVISDIEEYISTNVVPKETMIRLETLMDNIHIFIESLTHFKYYNDV